MSNFYSFKAKTLQGKEVSMEEYKDKVVLVVNTASKCGLTPQYEGLEKLHQKFKDKGLVVLGFPCNQFLSQEPLNNENMVETCLINHGVTFQLFEKINVKKGAILFESDTLFLIKKIDNNFLNVFNSWCGVILAIIAFDVVLLQYV